MRSPRTRFSSSCSDCWKGQFAPARVHRRPTDHCSSMERPPAHPKMKPSANCSRSVSTSTRTNWLGGSGERVLPESCLPISTAEPWQPSSSRTVAAWRSEEHTSELQSLMRSSYAVFCLKKKITTTRAHIKKDTIIDTHQNQNN